MLGARPAPAPLPPLIEGPAAAPAVTLLDVDVAAVVALDVPIFVELVADGPTATTAFKALTRGGVDGEGEEVLGLEEVGDKAAAQEKVGEADAVGDEHENQHDEEDALP